jgi:hypothetical protein
MRLEIILEGQQMKQEKIPIQTTIEIASIILYYCFGLKLAQRIRKPIYTVLT